VLRSIAEESGSRVQMNAKEEAVFTQERVLTISGTTGSCSKCVTLILRKLSEDMEAAQFLNRTTSYASFSPSLLGPMVTRRGAKNGGKEKFNERLAGESGSSNNNLNDAVVTNTVITLTVPDSIIGYILGKQVSILCK
jgi:hypothetical protein